MSSLPEVSDDTFIRTISSRRSCRFTSRELAQVVAARECPRIEADGSDAPGLIAWLERLRSDAQLQLTVSAHSRALHWSLVRELARVVQGQRMTPEHFLEATPAYLNDLRESGPLWRAAYRVAERAGIGLLGIGFDPLNEAHVFVLARLVRDEYVIRPLQARLVLVARACVTESELEAVTLVEKAASLEQPRHLAYLHRAVGGSDQRSGQEALRPQLGEEIAARTRAALGGAFADAPADAWEKMADWQKARPALKAVRQARNEAEEAQAKRPNAASHAAARQATRTASERVQANPSSMTARGVRAARFKGLARGGTGAAEPDPGAALEQGEQLGIARGVAKAMLAELSPRQLEAFMALEVEGLTLREAEQRLNVPRSTLDRAYRAARDRLGLA